MDQLTSLLSRLSVILVDRNIADVKNIKSSWSSIRPLVADPKSTPGDSASICRKHLVEVKDNIITICGGKWTIFRLMGEDTLKVILKQQGKQLSKTSKELNLYGCTGWTKSFPNHLVDKYNIEPDIAYYLSHGYGIAAEDM
ncbi:hypothetical protein HZS_1964, partial [Henneguya salminicola]